MAQKKAAISPEAIDHKKLNEISAADFLASLNAGGTSTVSALRVWPEKKKLELWAEPEGFGGVTAGAFREWLRREKKKLELEKPPGLEGFVDPRDFLRDPVFIKDVAKEVALELKRIK
jgi:hypothetical protein